MQPEPAHSDRPAAVPPSFAQDSTGGTGAAGPSGYGTAPVGPAKPATPLLPFGSLLVAVAALLVMLVVRGQSITLLVLAGGIEWWPSWVYVAILVLGAAAAVLVWGRWPGIGWLPAVIGAALAVPFAILGLTGATRHSASGQAYVLIGTAAQLAPAFLLIGVLGVARNLLLSGAARIAAAIAAAAVLIQLLPEGLLPSILPGAETGIQLDPEPIDATGVTDTPDPGSTSAMVMSVVLAALLLLVFVGAGRAGAEHRAAQREAPQHEAAAAAGLPVRRSLLVVGLAGTVLSYLPVFWALVVASSGGLDRVSAGMIVCGSVLLVLGPVLVWIGGSVLARGVLPAVLVMVVLHAVSPGLGALAEQYRGQLIAALVLGIAVGITLAVQRIAAGAAVVLTLVFAVLLLMITMNVRSFDSSDATVLSLILAAAVVAAGAVGCVVGGMTEVFGRGHSYGDDYGIPDDRPVRPAGDELVVGLGVLLPMIATGGTQLLAGVQLATDGPDEVWLWVLIGLTVLGAAALATWRLRRPSGPSGSGPNAEPTTAEPTRQQW